MLPILYKYLDVTGGMCMIGMGDKCNFPTLQFTNATQLNDPFDCHPNLVDYSEAPTKRDKSFAISTRKRTWLCSLSKSYNSLLMWSHYCANHKGICIGLDMQKMYNNMPTYTGVGMIYSKPLELEVQYLDVIENRPKYKSPTFNPWHYQLLTKAKDWEYEEEIRLVIENPHPFLSMITPEIAKQLDNVSDWREVRHYIPIKGECVESIYLGVNIGKSNKEKIINYARMKLNPKIKLFQMKVDENAFRLNAEPIIEK